MTHMTQEAMQTRIQELEEELQALKQQQTREYYNTEILASIPSVSVAMLDLEGRFLHADGQGLRAVGVNPEHLYGKTTLEAFGPEVFGMAEKHLEAAANGRVSRYAGEYAEHYSETIHAPQLDSNKNIIGITTLSINLTLNQHMDKIKTERDIALNQQNMLQLILEGTSDFVTMSTVDGELVYINQATQNILGLHDGEDITNKQLFDLYSDDMLQEIKGQIIPAALEAGTWSGEGSISTYDGRAIPVLQVFIGHKDDTGNVTHISTIMRDISNQKAAEAEQKRLQQEIIEAQQQALKDLSTPIIPLFDGVLVMPLVGSIDTQRSRDIMRGLLAGISEHRAKTVIVDITGVPVVDTGVADHLNKTIQAARLKGARTIVTGISDAVAETIVDLGIDWSAVETVRDLQSGLLFALDEIGMQLQNERH